MHAPVFLFLKLDNARRSEGAIIHSMPDIDVLIVTNKRHAILLRCVEGILRNSVLPKKIIIIQSDAPALCTTKKKILALCKKKGVLPVYRHITKRGISDKRNMAISYVTSSFFAYIDDDEIPPVDWLYKGLSFLVKHKNVSVVFGPKLPNIPDNYWNGVWKIITKVDQQSCYGSFATSSNGFYRTDFIKKNRIGYDPEFVDSSEDRVFSFRILEAGGKIYYLKNLITYHDFRTTFGGFVEQWIEYGYTMCLFNHKYYQVTKVSAHMKRLWQLLQGVRAGKGLSVYTVGLICCDLSFAAGYLKRMYQLLRVKKIRFLPI